MGDPEGPGRYDPATDELRWIEAWEASGRLPGDPESERDPYVIAVPLPNVTGSLHMGHALNNAMQDVLIRAHRMAGREAEWICGLDHAGIGTQAVVEKMLAAEGVRRQDLGREEFQRRVWAWKEESGGTIIGQQRRLGCTLDYANERFTLDPPYARAVQQVFVTLYEKGLIRRGRRMVNWDPGLGSAVSDLEVEDREMIDELVSIAYPLSDGGGEIVVATVRPETMLGDTAVAVNPDDERYRHLVGKTVTLPLVGRELPIIADAHVEVGFGTGALKVTPAHDPNDFDIAQRHGLDEVSVVGEDGRMTSLAGAYAGLTTAECRERIRADLEAAGMLRGVEAHTHNVPFSQRSGERIEPLLSLQWFCDMTDLAEPAIAAVKEERVRFTPERFRGVYLDWMENIRPWCISRQLWWGHQIPVWYRGDEVHVGMEAPTGDGWERDPDVLDTWFSSALWPFVTQGWPEETPALAKFYPGHVLVTGRDIIFLWVARMVMMGLEFLGEVPFADVCINPIIQAPDGRRMSKSLGTGIDPTELMEQHGADAVRFGMLIMASSQDVRFNEQRILQGRQLVTKLWNATSLVVQRGGGIEGEPPAELTLADRWIRGRLTEDVAAAERLLAEYEFSQYADLVYHLIFDDYCDWYLEFLKAGLATPAHAALVLEQILSLAHPILPFVTEACWERLPGAGGLMLTHASPTRLGALRHEDRQQVAFVQEITRATRAWRTDLGIAGREALIGTVEGQVFGSREAADLCASVAGVTWQAGAPDGAAVIPLSSGRLLLARVAGTVDTGAERARLTEALRKAEDELGRAEKMLANERFTDRAPAELVDAERQKVERFTGEVAAVRERLTALG